jgi:hypothetical protein
VESLGGLLASAVFLRMRGCQCGLNVLAGGWAVLRRKSLQIYSPLFRVGLLYGLVLGDFCSSKRGICLEQFRDMGGLA